MFFTQLDTISVIERGRSLQGHKCLTLAEEYLQDHFPGFPVMPGVMMLEALTQAAAWLIRDTEDFVHSMVVLGEAKNVKYSGFVEPGQTLHVDVEWMKEQDSEVSVKASGRVGDRVAVSARLTLKRYNLSDSVVAPARPGMSETDALLREAARAAFRKLYRPTREAPSPA